MTIKKTTTAKKKTTPTKKTTTTAKKTTTTAKKTTTVKKAAVKKTAVKKTTATKVVKTSSTEISVTGNKKIITLQKEFNKKFPYLRLAICFSYMRDAVKKGETISQIDGDRTLASVRRADSGGDISISGNKKIKSLENEFDKVFGLYVQVCYTVSDGHRYYTSGSLDEMTLAAFNEKCKNEGCKKGVYR